MSYVLWAAYLGRGLLVGEHRELRPQVVLDLEVEPAVEEVVTVGAEAVHLVRVRARG